MKQATRKLIGSHLRRVRGKGVGAALVRGSGKTLGVNMAGAGTVLLVQLLLARLMGVSSYGTFVYAFTWANLLGLICKIGFDVASLRFISEYRGKEEWGLLRGFLRRSDQIILVASLTTASVTAGVVWLLRDQLGQVLAATFWITCLLLPAYTLLQVRSSYLQALKRMTAAQASHLILRPALLGAGVFLVVLVFGGFSSAPTAMAVNLMAMIVALAVTSRTLSRTLPPALHTARAEYQTRMWGRVALPLMLVSGMSIVLSQISIIIVGVFVDTTEAGIYAVTSRIAAATVYGLTAVIYVASPLISELHSQGRRRELQRVITLATYGSLAFALPFFLGMVVFGKPVLGLFGPGFSEGYVALVILSMGHLINALTGPVKNSMIMTGHQNKAVQMMGAGALLNVVLNVLLIPLWGIQGAAVATVVATTTLNLAMAYWVQRRMGLKLISSTPRPS